jgi:8-oxo-dGTP pyrophosphatase MutT (NUDIX family)
MIDLHSVIRWSGHVSFVGGKNEPGETDEDTVKREVLEEIGIDLNDGYIKVGRLDEREITSIKDNKLLMMLSPFGNLHIYLYIFVIGKILTIKKKSLFANST